MWQALVGAEVQQAEQASRRVAQESQEERAWEQGRPWAVADCQLLITGHKRRRAYLRDHAHYETLFLNLVGFDGVRIGENLAWRDISDCTCH